MRGGWTYIMTNHVRGVWQRAWKIELVEGANPQWRDLWDHVIEAS